MRKSGQRCDGVRDALAALFGLALLACAGCDRDGLARPAVKAPRAGTGWFGEVTDPAGLQFTQRITVTGDYLISEQMGSGAAFLDYDNDGRLDVLLGHNVAPGTPVANGLFHQEPDGRFRAASAGSGLDPAGFVNGVAVGDVDNDGWPDVLFTEYDRVRLFRNQAGTGRFTDVTAAAGLVNHTWSVPAAFFDYDRDGWLDLVVGNYLDFDPTQRCPDARGQLDFCGPHGFRSTVTRLFHNVSGRAGTTAGSPRFEDVTMASGLGRSPGKAMGLVCADFDGDRWPDILVTDDGIANRLFVNRRDGSFAEQAVSRGLAYTGPGTPASNMGIALGDVDGDGLMDVFVPHLAEENHTLWGQGPAGFYQDRTAVAGLLAGGWHGTGFAPVLADFDNDGALDLAIANGLVRRRLEASPVPVARGVDPFWAAYAQPNQLFRNDGRGRFTDISTSTPSFCGEAQVGRGLVAGDIDNDGAPDLLLSSAGGPARLYRNVAALRGHWLGLRLTLPASGGRDAYGAEVVVRTAGRRWHRLVQPAQGYASSQDPRVLFGLGTATQVEAIDVVWPDGRGETFDGGSTDQYRVLRQGTGKPSA